MNWDALGQQGNGLISGTFEGNNFEFSIPSAGLGTDVAYQGELMSDRTVKGFLIVQGQNMGAFTGNKES